MVGVFDDTRMAQAAVEELRRVGFREDQIGVVTRDAAAGEHGATIKEGTGSHWEEGAAIGAAAGAGIGALWAVGMATIALPPILPAVLVSSWLVSILASAASGAAIAGVAGALIGLGIPEDEATYYEGEFHSGRTPRHGSGSRPLRGSARSPGPFRRLRLPEPPRRRGYRRSERPGRAGRRRPRGTAKLRHGAVRTASEATEKGRPAGRRPAGLSRSEK